MHVQFIGDYIVNGERIGQTATANTDSRICSLSIGIFTLDLVPFLGQGQGMHISTVNVSQTMTCRPNVATANK